MKSIVRLCLILVLFFPKTISSQTVLIDSLQEGGFNLGNSLAANGWSVPVSSASNVWYAGSVPNAFSGNSAYVSDTGGSTWSYVNNGLAATSHFYRDIVLPQGINYLELSFQWINFGEVNPNDVLMVSIAPSNYTPSQSNSTSVILAPPAQTLAVLYNKNVVSRKQIFFNPQVVNTCTSSANIRLIFSFRYNNSLGSNPPPAVDNISLILHNSNIGTNGGLYTLDYSNPISTNNFHSLARAISSANAASQCLMTDSVLLDIPSNQVFKEDLPWINYTGNANSVLKIFKSGLGKSSVLEPTGGAWTRDFGLGLSGAKYVEISDLDIIPSASNLDIEYGIYIKPANATAGCQNVKISNCKIILNKANTRSIGILQTTNSSLNGFSITSQSGTNSFNEIKSVAIENVAQGIILNGTSTSYYDEGNILGGPGFEQIIIGGSIPNDIGGSLEVCGIWASFQKNISVLNVQVRNIFTNGGFGLYGIRFTDCTGNIKISQNSISNFKNISMTSWGPTAGIYLVGTTPSAAYEISNNFIYGMNLSYVSSYINQYVAGITLGHTGANSNIYYNTVSIQPTGYLSTAALYAGSGTVTCKNNILINTSDGNNNVNFRHCLKIVSGVSVSSSNNNCMYVGSSQNCFLVGSSAGVNYNSLSAWSTASGHDNLSINTLPDFVSNENLHIQTTSFKVDRKGISIPGVFGDIDNDLRDGSFPDIGADEYNPISNGPDVGIYSISGINIVECFSSMEQISVHLKNTSINIHDFSIAPVEISISVNGAYNYMYSFNVTAGVLQSYEDTTLLVPYFFNFSNGGSFTITANIVFSADVNILNNTISANYSQAVIPQSVNENFNQSTSLPAGWTLNSGWSISPVYGIFSNGLYRNFNSNSSSTFLLPAYGSIQPQDTFSFDFRAVSASVWGRINISISTDCGNTYSNFDTLDYIEYPGGNMKWNHYSVDLSQFVDKIIWIKLDVYSINGGVIAFDNFNTIGCQEPVSPNNLELTSTGLYSLAGTFSQGIADNYLIVMYPHTTAPDSLPVDGFLYETNTYIGNGKVIQNSSLNYFSVSNLEIATTYDFYIYSIIGANCSGGPKYQSINPLTGSATTNSCSGTGTYSIGTSGSNYISITAALSNLALMGIQDTVIFEIQSDYISENKVVFNSIGCNDSTHVLIIRPAANVVNDIVFYQPASASGYVLDFNKCLGVFIDGRPGGAGLEKKFIFRALNGSTINFRNESNHINISHCKIEGTPNSDVTGIIQIWKCNFLTLEKNDIGNPSYMAPILINFANQNNSFVKIEDNNLFNFSSKAISISNAYNGVVSNNSFYFTVPLNKNGVSIQVIASLLNFSLTISENWIGGTGPHCSGNYMEIVNTSTSLSGKLDFSGIYCSGIYNQDIVVYNNIKNIKLTTGYGAGIFNAIGTYIGAREINYNQIGDVNDPNSIIVSLPNSSNSYTCNGIYFYNPQVGSNIKVKIIGNSIRGISCNSQTTMKMNISGINLDIKHYYTETTVDSNTIKGINCLARGAAFGIQCLKDDISGGSTGHVGTINNNVISNLYMPYGRSLGIYYDSNNLKGIVAHNKIVNLFSGDTILSGSFVFNELIFGCYTEGNISVYNNDISNIGYNNVKNVKSVVLGVYMVHLGPLEQYSAARNKVYNILNYSTSTGSVLYGMLLNGSSFKMYNNAVALDLSQAKYSKIYGVYSCSGSRDYKNNSIKLTGLHLGGQNTHSVYFADNILPCNIGNNIIINTSTGLSGQRKHFCFGGVFNPVLNTNLKLINNIYYFDSVNGGLMDLLPYIYFDEITHAILFADDTLSFTADPLLDPDTILPLPTKGSRIEKSGKYEFVIEDLNGNTRDQLSPIDLGAIAGDFINSFSDLSVKAKVRSLSCDSNEISIFIKNVSSIAYNFASSPAQLLLSLIGGIKTYQLGHSIETGILLSGQEMVFNLHIPIISRQGEKIKISINSDLNENSNNNVVQLSLRSLALNGQYLVGQNGDFSTLSEAIYFYNASHCLDGDITFILTDSVYNETTEVFPIVISANKYSESAKLIIKPKYGKNVSIEALSAISSPLFVLQNARNVIFDGIDTLGATTLQLKSFSINNPCVLILGHVNKVSFRNCIISGKNNSSYGLFCVESSDINYQSLEMFRCNFSPVAGAEVIQLFTMFIYHNNVQGFARVKECSFKDYGYIGISSPFNTWNHMDISKNLFSSTTVKSNSLNAIKLHSGKHLTVLSNSFQRQRSTGKIEIISFSSFDTLYLCNNLLFNDNISGFTKDHNALVVNSVNFIKMNNNIFRLSWTGTHNGSVQGVKIDGARKTIIDHNTFYLEGVVGNSTYYTNVLSQFKISDSILLRNNICFNGISSTTAHRFAIHLDTSNFKLVSDNNIFIGAGTIADQFFYYKNSSYNFDQWKQIPHFPDQHSYAFISNDPAGGLVTNYFVSSNDLHLNSDTCLANNTGTFLSSELIDFEGNARSYLSPDIGADEIQDSCLEAYVPFISSDASNFCIGEVSLIKSNVSLSAAIGNSFTWQYKYSGQNQFETINTNFTNVDSLFHVMENADTVYFRQLSLCSISGKDTLSNVISLSKQRNIVTSSMDSIYGSLRKVIGCISKNDTVYIQPGLDTIYLKSGIIIDKDLFLVSLNNNLTVLRFSSEIGVTPDQFMIKLGINKKLWFEKFELDGLGENFPLIFNKGQLSLYNILLVNEFQTLLVSDYSDTFIHGNVRMKK